MTTSNHRDPGNCANHEEMVKNDVETRTLIKVIIGIAAFSSVLLSYSVFWQAPAIRTDVTEKIGKLEKADALLEQRMGDAEKRIVQLEGK